MKTCPKCDLEKPLTEFYKNRSAKNGLGGWCKKCELSSSAEYRAKNVEALRQRRKENYAANSAILLLKNKRYRQSLGLEQRRKIVIKRKYGLAADEFLALETEQKGSCAICENKFSSERKINIDHIHNSDPVVIRGLLCAQCNTGLGLFKDSPECLIKAAAYLKKFQK